MKKSLITFLLLFNDLKYGKNSLFVVMVTVMQFSQFFFLSKRTKKAFTKENFKVLMTLLLLVLLPF